MSQNQDLYEKAAIPANTHQAITSGLASKMAQDHANRANQSRQKAKETNESSLMSNQVKNVWQHPYVDVFKHFKLMPTQDWKQNKKQGDVQEYFVSLYQVLNVMFIGQGNWKESFCYQWINLCEQLYSDTKP